LTLKIALDLFVGIENPPADLGVTELTTNALVAHRARLNVQNFSDLLLVEKLRRNPLILSRILRVEVFHGDRHCVDPGESKIGGGPRSKAIHRRFSNSKHQRAFWRCGWSGPTARGTGEELRQIGSSSSS
jgi:hypothetical protein